MTNVTVYPRILRRETHAARTAPAVFLALVVVLVLLATLVLGVWVLVDSALHTSTHDLAQQIFSSGGFPLGVTIGSIVLIVLSFILIALALMPGRLHRRGRIAGRLAILADDGFLANATADRVAADCGTQRAQVSVTVARRLIKVQVIPNSGQTVEHEAVRHAAEEAWKQLGFKVKVKTAISPRGAVS